MAKCPCRVQCVKGTKDTAAERESGDRSRTEDGENGGRIGLEGKKVLRVEGARIVGVEAPTGETVLKICMLFAKTAL